MALVNTLIVEDNEFSMQQLLDVLAKYCPAINVVDKCKTGVAAAKAIKKHSPQLVLLDVELPDMTSVEMLKTLPAINFDIIFITAHDQYALPAIKFAALDYLLKPVDPLEVVAAINKAVDKNKERHLNDKLQQLMAYLDGRMEPLANLGVPTMEGMVFVKVADILRCEGLDKYTKIFTVDGKYNMSSRNLGEFEDLLGNAGFVRVHKSHIVSVQHIVKYIKGEGGQVVMADGSVISVSRRSKNALLGKVSLFK
jgi:two-component system LytT family response regulator